MQSLPIVYIVISPDSKDLPVFFMPGLTLTPFCPNQITPQDILYVFSIINPSHEYRGAYVPNQYYNAQPH